MGKIMPMIKIACLCALLLLGISPAQAKDMHEKHAVFGIGSETCQHFASAYQQRDYALVEYKIWIAGYLSAFNLIVPGTFNIMGQRNLSHALDTLANYCQEHPDILFVTAAATLTEHYYDERINFVPSETPIWKPR